MPVLDDITVVVPGKSLPEITADDIKDSIARQFWAWYYAHADHVIIKRKFLWISVSIKVADLYPLFHTLFGEPDR